MNHPQQVILECFKDWNSSELMIWTLSLLRSVPLSNNSFRCGASIKIHVLSLHVLLRVVSFKNVSEFTLNTPGLVQDFNNTEYHFTTRKILAVEHWDYSGFCYKIAHNLLHLRGCKCFRMNFSNIKCFFEKRMRAAKCKSHLMKEIKLDSSTAS